MVRTDGSYGELDEYEIKSLNLVTILLLSLNNETPSTD